MFMYRPIGLAISITYISLTHRQTDTSKYHTAHRAIHMRCMCVAR